MRDSTCFIKARGDCPNALATANSTCDGIGVLPFMYLLNVSLVTPTISARSFCVQSRAARSTLIWVASAAPPGFFCVLMLFTICEAEGVTQVFSSHEMKIHPRFVLTGEENVT